jgi:hypothetical protein
MITISLPNGRLDRPEPKQQDFEQSPILEEVVLRDVPIRPAGPELEDAVERQILQRTSRRIRRLRVEVASGRVTVHGQVSSYYVKQLAILAVLETLAALRSHLVADVHVGVEVRRISPRAVPIKGSETAVHD